MSTDFMLLKKISAGELFDGRLQEFGVREHTNDKTGKKARMLTDGNNYLWVYVTDDGFVSCLTRYAPNGAPGKILSAISEAFDADIVSEYEPQFWGFDTEEEWDAAMAELSRKADEKFYADLMKYVAGEPHNFRRGTIGMIQAKIAKKLVKKDSSLLLPLNKDKLLKEMQSIYERDCAVVVKLTPEDVAFAEMSVTHEDDLPQA
jgi:hypothetical protein